MTQDATDNPTEDPGEATPPQKLEAAIGAEIRRQRKRQDMTMAMLADAAEADALWRTAEKSGSRLVAREAKFRRAKIDTEQRQR